MGISKEFSPKWSQATLRSSRRNLKKTILHPPENISHNHEKKYHKIPGRQMLRTYLLGFATFIIVLHFITVHYNHRSEQSRANVRVERSIINHENKTSYTMVSVVILTYKSTELFSNLLSTVISQKQDYFEVIIVDAGCLDESKEVINKYYPKNSQREKHLKYLPQCHNPGYAVANNEGAGMAARSSEWILFLNDDLELQGDKFIDDMLQLANSKPNLGIVGCKLMNGSGDEIDEAGSIVWSDGSAAGFGRGRTDIKSSEFLYPRPVDYISGACIMVKKRIFADYGGFDSERFPSYYEDADLQMHVQHEIRKEVWLQPRSIANHVAHSSFGKEESTKLMQKNSKDFARKWSFSLRDKHLRNLPHLTELRSEVHFLKASDLRARDLSKANILYIDLDLPKNTKNKELNRSYENLLSLSNLGHRITVVSYRDTSDEKCDFHCRDDLQKYGIEVATGSWYDLAKRRIGFYDTVIISQPLTFLLSYKELATLYRKAPFVLIYDFDTLQYPNYEAIIKLQKDGYQLSSKPFESMDESEKDFMLKKYSEIENKLIATADIVVTSSKEDVKRILTVPIHRIGHVQSVDRQRLREYRKRKDILKFPSFLDRSGILFLLSFGVNTDYNIDAIFFFLEKIYISVLNESPAAIPLTIAGNFIPENLRQFVENHFKFKNMVTFIQTSEEYYTSLYEKVRVVILPQLYGNGMVYQVSSVFKLYNKLSGVIFLLTRNQLFDIHILSHK